MRSDALSIEAKYTDAKQYPLKHAELLLAEKHALIDGRESVFIVSFAGDEWAIVREADYRDLRERAGTVS